PAVEQPSPPVESSPLVMESASASKTPPETATSVSPPAPETALPAPTVESNKVVVTSESPKSGPSKAVPTPTPAQVAPKPKAQPPRQVATARPTPDNSEAAPKPKPQPEPIAPQETVASQPPPSPAMVVAVVADVSDRAGIRESAEAYARRASGEITQRAGEIFDKDRVVDNGTLADLRDHLQTGEEDYAGLCQKWQADILILGDFRIVTGYSTIDSAYWPDYHLHLYNCGTQRSNHEVFKHLNPSNQDSFPFEQAINQKTMKFLTDSRWVVGS
ncbi:MAG: hypothetical protein P8098_03690, partial [Candidatus Thiodiazotropha sp.]